MKIPNGHIYFRRIDFVFAFGTIFLVLAASSFTVWIRWFTAPPLTYQLPISVNSQTVEAGEPLSVTSYICNNESDILSYTFTRSLRGTDNRVRYTMAPSAFVAYAGCQKYDSIINAVPDTIPPGEYVFEGVSTVRGRWSTYDIYWYTVPFTVTASER